MSLLLWYGANFKDATPYKKITINAKSPLTLISLSNPIIISYNIILTYILINSQNKCFSLYSLYKIPNLYLQLTVLSKFFTYYYLSLKNNKAGTKIIKISKKGKQNPYV